MNLVQFYVYELDREQVSILNERFEVYYVSNKYVIIYLKFLLKISTSKGGLSELGKSKPGTIF